MIVKTTYKGKFMDMNVARSIENNTRRLLRNVGEAVSKKMKTYTDDHDWTGRLTDSITWRTQYDSGDMGSKAFPNDLIDKPSRPDSVDIGTANPYAYFREFGAGPHVSSEGAEAFIRSMKLWFRDKIGEDPDGEGKQHFWNIVKKIQQGQKAHPFLLPSLAFMDRVAKVESRLAEFGRNVK